MNTPTCLAHMGLLFHNLFNLLVFSKGGLLLECVYIFDFQSGYKKNLGLEFESTEIKILEKNQDNKLTRQESVGFNFNFNLTILIFLQSL